MGARARLCCACMGGTSTAGGAQRCSCPRDTAATADLCCLWGPGHFPAGTGSGPGERSAPGVTEVLVPPGAGCPQVPAVFAMGSAVTALLPAPLPSACSWLTRARATYPMSNYQLRNLIRGSRHRGSHAFLNACPPHQTEQGLHPPAAQKPGQWPPNKFSSHTTHRRSRLGSPPAFSHRGERADRSRLPGDGDRAGDRDGDRAGCRGAQVPFGTEVC